MEIEGEPIARTPNSIRTLAETETKAYQLQCGDQATSSWWILCCYVYVQFIKWI